MSKPTPEPNPIEAVDPPQVEDVGNVTPLSPAEDVVPEPKQHTKPKD